MIKRILIPLDRSTLAEQAIGHAMTIARGSGAEVHLVLAHESPVLDESASGRTDPSWDEERVYLASVAHELRSTGNVSVSLDIVSGKPADAIVRCASEKASDLIVMTSHGRTGLIRMWLGSVTDTVIRRACVPVLVMRRSCVPEPRGRMARKFGHILVPLDDTSIAQVPTHAGVDLAIATGASLTLLHVVHPVSRQRPIEPFAPEAYMANTPDEEATNSLVTSRTAELNETAALLRDTSGLRVDATVIVSSRVANTIIAFAAANGVDAIAMSTHGRGASRYLIGSVADKVLRATDLPVLVHRPRKVSEDLCRLCDRDIAEQLPALSGW